MNNISNIQSGQLDNLTDENLYQLCKTYGSRALLWRQKFIGLLPEVFKRKLYERRGFSSIFEFAKKLAGLSEEQVRRVLNLEEKFASLPALKSLLVNGEVSANKLMRVASIANTENEIFLAGQVQLLSKSAVETLVRDEKYRSDCDMSRMTGGTNALGENNPNQDGLKQSFFCHESVPGHGFKSDDIKNVEFVGAGKIDKNSLKLSSEIQQKLLELQQKGFDLNALLAEFLKEREEKIAQQKEQIAEEVLQKEEAKVMQNRCDYSSANKYRISRYIPQAVKNILTKEFGHKCSIKNCQKTATQIHHTQRFSISRSHDPHYLAPLCKGHHELAHAVDVSYRQVREEIRS